MRWLFILFSSVISSFALTDAQLDSIGKKVWQNECGGTEKGLTSWNGGENFASLGIGHFIWYPRGVRGPFEESFPKLVDFLGDNGVKTPEWLEGDCPWPTQKAFYAAARSERMVELRALLVRTIHLQSRFLAQRMEQSMSKMLRAAPQADHKRIQKNFARLLPTTAGTFALIDYVNFKGEGTNPGERYHGEGWGLLQVLSAMDETGPAPAAFARAAAAVLERRVKNSDPQRREAQWLPGWRSRVRAYGG